MRIIRLVSSFTHHESRFPETDKISPPILQMDDVTFGYTPEKIVLRNVSFDVGLESRIAIVGANGAGKSTLYVSFYIDQYCR